MFRRGLYVEERVVLARSCISEGGYIPVLGPRVAAYPG